MKRNPNITIGTDANGFPRATGLSFSDDPQVFTSADDHQVPRYPWQLFKGLGWPMGIDDEEEFLLDVTVAAKGASADSWDRSDVTILSAYVRPLHGMKCMSFSLVFPARVLSAYRHLEAGLKHALKG